MTRVNTLRRRMLRQAVEENYSTMHGVVAPSVHRRRRLRGVSKVLAYAVAVGAIFGASFVVASRAFDASPGEERTVLLVPPPMPRPVRSTTGPSTVPEPSSRVGRGVLPFSVRRVMIDPGHGGSHRGTASARGIEEKTITLDVAERLAKLLEAGGFEPLLTRTRDETLELTERSDAANEQQADVFLSIHVNWFSESTARAVETFYLGPTDDESLQRLAARENLDSQMPLGEFRRSLEQVYANVRREESKELALAVQQELLKSLQTINPWVEDRGVKSAPFVVLIRTEMPAILAEVGCLSNDEEAQLLESPNYRQYLAEAIFEGVRSYALKLNPNLTLGS